MTSYQCSGLLVVCSYIYSYNKIAAKELETEEDVNESDDPSDVDSDEGDEDENGSNVSLAPTKTVSPKTSPRTKRKVLFAPLNVKDGLKQKQDKKTAIKRKGTKAGKRFIPKLPEETSKTQMNQNMNGQAEEGRRKTQKSNKGFWVDLFADMVNR